MNEHLMPEPTSSDSSRAADDKTDNVIVQKVLIFGDQSCVDYLADIAAPPHRTFVEAHDGLAGCDPIFDFLLDLALDEQHYDILVVSIGANDLLDGGRTECDVRERQRQIATLYGTRVDRVLVVGPLFNSEKSALLCGERLCDDAKRRTIGREIVTLLRCPVATHRAIINL